MMKLIFEGLSVLSNWQIYIAIVGYLIVPYSLEGLFSYINNEKVEDFRKNYKTITMIFISGIHVFAICFATFTIAPFLLEISLGVAWSYPWDLLNSNPTLLLKIILASIFVVFLIANFPFGKVPAIQILFVASITFLVSIHLFHKTLPEFDASAISSIVPPVKTMLFFFIISICSTLFTALFYEGIRFIFLKNKKNVFYDQILVTISSFWCFIPLFVYGAWIKNQL